MSTSSASAATIFDLVIGFAIDSFLQWALRAPGAGTHSKRRAILHGDSGAVSRSEIALARIWRGRARSAGGVGVADEEHRLPGADEAELLAGEPLDRARVGAQGGDLG